jgi:hypothetical protein
MDETWKSDLERWLAPFLGALRHKARARMCPVYVAGLIGAGDRNGCGANSNEQSRNCVRAFDGVKLQGPCSKSVARFRPSREVCSIRIDLF